MERCPVCRARLGDEPHCRRCGSDLSRPRQLVQAAERWQRAALQALAAGEHARARRALARAQALHRTPFGTALTGWLSAAAPGSNDAP